MPRLKLCTWNIEWMLALFGAPRDAAWRADPRLPASFAGVQRGSIRLEPIADVPALARRIAGVIRRIAPDVLFVQEGPPLVEQMQRFVADHLDDGYVVHRSNRDNQAVHALVRRPLADRIEPWLPAGETAATLWRDVPYYPWGQLAPSKRALQDFAREPLLLRAALAAGQDLILCGVHTKSKFSQLKTRRQWEERAAQPGPVRDALTTRQKLSAEVRRLREVLTRILAGGPAQANVIVLGDFNDGPFQDLLEREFLVRNILDELVGSLLDPNTWFRHAMDPATLARASTTRFRDPLQGGALVEELIDHVLVAPGLWSRRGAYKVRKGSCRVERAAWQTGVVGDPDAARENRPSDHQPVSVVIEW